MSIEETQTKKIEVIGSEEKPLSWEEFLKQVKADEANITHHWPWIYRGHQNFIWDLETTLERSGQTNYGIEDYYSKIRNIIPSLNTEFPRQWKAILDPTDDAKKLFNNAKENGSCRIQITTPPHIELLGYLRHHGFPSPFLDWTESFYIATFFAFRDAHPNQDKNVAIWALQTPQCLSHDGKLSDEALIVQTGDAFAIHSRHLNQQSFYTYCRAEIKGQQVFTSHHDALENNTNRAICTKYILKESEKQRVLADLHSMNINDYTLFGDEESLMQTLAYKVFHQP